MLGNWDSSKWQELDWSKIKELQTRDLIEARDREAQQAQLGHCFDCSNFVKHVRRT